MFGLSAFQLPRSTDSVTVGFPIEDKFVVAVASSALFDLAESDAVFRTQGPSAYRIHQRQHEHLPFGAGVAFPLIRRLLHLNDDFPETRPVEVVLLSRNDPDTGLRAFNTIEHLDLDISRAAFVSGRDPFRYMETFNASLFLSANPDDVQAALNAGLPAGRVYSTSQPADDGERELRIAFDFDGVLADDSAERVFQEQALAGFHESERTLGDEPMLAGPLRRFLEGISKLQQMELEKQATDDSYVPRIRTAIVTARNAPAHRRVITTLRHWGIQVDEAFFLGGIDKSKVLKQFKPHIFFDDQMRHVEDASTVSPVVHIPFGVANKIPKRPETE